MPQGKKFTAEQIIGKLREAEVGFPRGKTVPEVVRKLGVTEQTYYRWKREYDGLRRAPSAALRAERRRITAAPAAMPSTVTIGSVVGSGTAWNTTELVVPSKVELKPVTGPELRFVPNMVAIELLENVATPEIVVPLA